MQGESKRMATLKRISMLYTFSFLLGIYLSLVASPGHARAASNDAYVRIIHASPFVGVADIFVDGKSLLNSFPFADVTDYVPVPAGEHRVQIALVGKGIDASALTKDLKVEAGQVYTVAAIGASPNELGLQIFIDNNQVAPDRSKVRIYHLSPDAGVVSVALNGQDQATGLGYKDSSDYITLDQGAFTFNVKAAQYNLPLDIQTNLKANTITSIFAVGMVNGEPALRLVTAQTQGIPGLPQTGNVPVLADMVKPMPMLWLACAVVILMAGSGFVRYRIYKRA